MIILAYISMALIILACMAAPLLVPLLLEGGYRLAKIVTQQETNK